MRQVILQLHVLTSNHMAQLYQEWKMVDIDKPDYKYNSYII